MPYRPSIGEVAYGGLVAGLSFLHYGVLSRFSNSDEGGIAWLRRRLTPVIPAATGARRIWIHAVSAGESKVAELLHAALLAQDPKLSVVLSATTYSGFARIEKVAGPASSFIMPLDTPAAQERLFETLKPDLLVLVESEYWPAQFAAARRHGVPVVVVNATLSERSYARHRRFDAVARRTLLQAAHIHVQDRATLGRYASLGVPAERLSVCGNLKLAALGAAMPGERPMRVTFGNVHRAELEALGPAVRRLRGERPDVQMVLVPRYPGRLPEAELRAAVGNEVAMVDDAGGLDGAGHLVWLDRMGVLAATYARSMLGVVCGTFAPIGGHDLSEPLQQGAPSMYGPHVHRQRSLQTTLREIGAGEEVADGDALIAAIGRLLDDAAERARRVQSFAGAAEAARAELKRLAESLRQQIAASD
jgi:3-deoxy-D-manno-octulosonic-acid transferase